MLNILISLAFILCFVVLFLFLIFNFRIGGRSWPAFLIPPFKSIVMATSSTNDSSVSTSLATSLPANYDFPDISDYLKTELAIALDGLCYEAYRQSVTLRPFRIRNCNAADSNRGKSFSEAYCDVEMESNKAFLLGDLFRHGLDMLIEFIENKTIPESKEKQIVLSKLLSFIKSSK